MKKITRIDFSDLAQVMLQISDREQRSFVGGGSGTANDPYTVLEFEMMSANGTWNGGYVYGWGYTFPQIEVYGSDSGGDGYGNYGNYGEYGSNYPWGDDPWGYNPWGNFGDHGGDDPWFHNSGYGNSGSNGYGDYNYNYDNSDGYDYYYYGYHGRGSGNGNENGTSDGDYIPPENQVKWESIEEIIFIRFAALGIDLSKYTIIVEDGTGNAHINDDGKIILRDSFFNRPSCDQESVLGHETIHKDKDVPYNPKKNPIKEEDFNFSPEMSDDVFEYYKTINYGDSKEEIVKNLKDALYIIYNGELSDPQKYLNEINAYEEEIRLFPNVSDEYRMEREGKLYFYKELYKMALDAQNKK